MVSARAVSSRASGALLGMMPPLPLVGAGKIAGQAGPYSIAATAARIVADASVFYTNVHTGTFLSGAVRGQLTLLSREGD